MNARYLLCPGIVRSRTDGDRHFITARQLAFLYGVRMADCVTLPDQTPANHCVRMFLFERVRLGEITALVPRDDGNYTIPGAVA